MDQLSGTGFGHGADTGQSRRRVFIGGVLLLLLILAGAWWAFSSGKSGDAAGDGTAVGDEDLVEHVYFLAGRPACSLRSGSSRLQCHSPSPSGKGVGDNQRLSRLRAQSSG
jgi:hypothetical protein